MYIGLNTCIHILLLRNDNQVSLTVGNTGFAFGEDGRLIVGQQSPMNYESHAFRRE
ncbi:MAG: hypothetical protein BAJALOKI3v1_850013 [Promethearchaeota archaeon]|nr:MAG: hypothetical protein BAJALOKI3v1_850013 [Candidatus Lokiarchaeota archaeon]